MARPRGILFIKLEMSSIVVNPASCIGGTLSVPGDKSISHRAIILGSLAKGTTVIRNLLESDDTLVTIEAFRRMGVSIEKSQGGEYRINGVGLNGLSRPDAPLAMGESGTTMRLMMGVLAGQPFQTTLAARESLVRRPMLRIVTPLRQMGAQIEGKDGAEHAPITILGGALRPIRYLSPVASAQIKSAVLLAGLYAAGETEVIEPSPSRDHTERMLACFGVRVRQQRGQGVSIQGPAQLKPQEIEIPGDFSSAAFFIVAALLVPNSSLILQGVSLNPTRTGLAGVLQNMGGHIEMREERGAAEPFGEIRVKTSALKGVSLDQAVIPAMIDEIPILMVAAALAKGRTTIHGAGELRVKETDRISSMSDGLRAMGARITVTDGDDLVIEGVSKLRGATVDSRGDHRTAMALVIAGLTAEGQTTVEGTECMAKSFPTFMESLRPLKSG